MSMGRGGGDGGILLNNHSCMMRNLKADGCVLVSSRLLFSTKAAANDSAHLSLHKSKPKSFQNVYRHHDEKRSHSHANPQRKSQRHEKDRRVLPREATATEKPSFDQFSSQIISLASQKKDTEIITLFQSLYPTHLPDEMFLDVKPEDMVQTTAIDAPFSIGKTWSHIFNAYSYAGEHSNTWQALNMMKELLKAFPSTNILHHCLEWLNMRSLFSHTLGYFQKYCNVSSTTATSASSSLTNQNRMRRASQITIEPNVYILECVVTALLHMQKYDAIQNVFEEYCVWALLRESDEASSHSMETNQTHQSAKNPFAPSNRSPIQPSQYLIKTYLIALKNDFQLEKAMSLYRALPHSTQVNPNNASIMIQILLENDHHEEANEIIDTLTQTPESLVKTVVKAIVHHTSSEHALTVLHTYFSHPNIETYPNLELDDIILWKCIKDAAFTGDANILIPVLGSHTTTKKENVSRSVIMPSAEFFKNLFGVLSSRTAQERWDKEQSPTGASLVADFMLQYEDLIRPMLDQRDSSPINDLFSTFRLVMDSDLLTKDQEERLRDMFHER